MRSRGYGLPRIILPRTPVNRAKKKGQDIASPGPSLSCLSTRCVRSLLALLLSASQEVVRDPPYGVRGPAYRIRNSAYRIGDSAYRSRRRYFEEANFIPLHASYRSPASLSRLLALPVGRFLR